jgi:hypothetical protein
VALKPVRDHDGEGLGRRLDRRLSSPDALQDFARLLSRCCDAGVGGAEPGPDLLSGGGVEAIVQKLLAPLGWTRIQSPRNSGSGTA